MWCIWGSDDKIPNVIFYLLKGGCGILDRVSCLVAGREYVFSELRGVWARDLGENRIIHSRIFILFSRRRAALVRRFALSSSGTVMLPRLC